MKTQFLHHSFFAVFFLAMLSACASNPTGGVNFVLMSEKAEISKGKELHEALLKETPIYDNPKLQAYIDSIGQKIATTSHRPNLTYTFTIIDSPDINAFALPGGYIYINRGLIAYLRSEAQLAAVLGHEIGHVTARHTVRQQTAGRTAKILSGALVVATGATSLLETTSILSGALISGYGRDMELEADSLGAEYLFNSGYEPNAMVEVITVLKNHEDFTKKISGKAVSYHGLFASHPRNDARLNNVIEEAGHLSEQQLIVTDPGVFRKHLDGLLIGPSIQTSVGNSEGRNRYYQNLLNYTLVLPKDWLIEETTTTFSTTSSSRDTTLSVKVRRLQSLKEPRLYIREELAIPNLQSTETLSQFGLNGYTGLDPQTNNRIAVIYYGPRAYIFSTSTDSDNSISADETFLAIIKSFRPISNNERRISNPTRLRYIHSEGESYEELARDSRLPQNPEDLLRLYNGDYPSKEPSFGDWIKVVD